MAKNCSLLKSGTKGQLSSKQNRRAVTSPKEGKKCTQDTIWVCLVCFLGELTARQFCFEIYWPLDCDFFGCQSGVQCNAVAASNHQQLKKELNVSKSRKQITAIWILPKNKPNALSASGYYTESRSLSLPECIPFDFWKNPQRLNLLSRISDLYKIGKKWSAIFSSFEYGGCYIL